MKRLSNLLAALVFASLVIFMSCGGGGDDPAPDPLEEIAADLTISGWAQPSTVQTDGGVADGDWSGFTITFSGTKDGGNYTVQNVPDSIYKASYPAWFLSKESLDKILSKFYDIISSFHALDGTIKISGKKAKSLGYICRLKS